MDSARIPEQALSHFGDAVRARHSNRWFPLSGQWELTCRCNLRCQMCYTDCFNQPARIREELSTAEVLRVLGELREAGCLEIAFTGGEPLARPDFAEIYRAAHAQGFLLTVFTNGTLVNESWSRLWTEAPPQGVEISLHSLSPITFECVTGIPGSFENCLRAIHLLAAARIPLTLKAVAMTLNRGEVLEVKQFARSLGPGVAFRLGETLRDDLAGTGRPYAYQLTEEELALLAARDEEIAKEKCGQSLASSGCAGGGGRFHIDAYGRLQLCSGNRQAGFDLRRGSFREGFFKALPQFPCPRKAASAERPMMRPLPVLARVEV